MLVISGNIILHAHAWLCIHESTVCAKITLVQKCLKMKNSWSGHLLCADQEHAARWMCFSKGMFNVCRKQGHSRAPVAVPPLLLCMNKLILLLNIAYYMFIQPHGRHLSSPRHQRSMTAERHSSVCHVPYLQLAEAITDLLDNLEP